MAIDGPARGSVDVGTRITPEGARAFVLASGQPAAVMPQPSDTANRQAGGASGLPGSVLAVPCGDSDVVGVLEVSGKAGGVGFSFVDIEALSGLALVAGALLAQDHQVVVDLTPPEQISAEIHALARRNPGRYATVVAVIEAMLGVE